MALTRDPNCTAIKAMDSQQDILGRTPHDSREPSDGGARLSEMDGHRPCQMN
jgi:hypothetical protein